MLLTCSARFAEARSKTRSEVATYARPSIGMSGTGLCDPSTEGCVLITPTLYETMVKVQIRDDLDTKPYASIMTDFNGDRIIDQSRGLCGATDGFVSLPQDGVTMVAVWQGPGVFPTCLGGASSGLVKLTYR